jgi:hypothetical protein
MTDRPTDREPPIKSEPPPKRRKDGPGSGRLDEDTDRKYPPDKIDKIRKDEGAEPPKRRR